MSGEVILNYSKKFLQHIKLRRERVEPQSSEIQTVFQLLVHEFLKGNTPRDYDKGERGLKIEDVTCTLFLKGLIALVFCPFSSVQSLSHVWLFATPWIAARQAFLSITNSRSLPKIMSIKSVIPSSHLILCRPLLLLPRIPPSIRVFSNESALRIRWPEYWSFSFSIIPSNEHPRLISFRMDWLDLLAVLGTPRSLLQHQSSKASILQRSAFFTVQLSHPYMTTGKP